MRYRRRDINRLMAVVMAVVLLLSTLHNETIYSADEKENHIENYDIYSVDKTDDNVLCVSEDRSTYWTNGSSISIMQPVHSEGELVTYSYANGVDEKFLSLENDTIEFSLSGVIYVKAHKNGNTYKPIVIYRDVVAPVLLESTIVVDSGCSHTNLELVSDSESSVLMYQMYTNSGSIAFDVDKNGSPLKPVLRSNENKMESGSDDGVECTGEKYKITLYPGQDTYFWLEDSCGNIVTYHILRDTEAEGVKSIEKNDGQSDEFTAVNRDINNLNLYYTNESYIKIILQDSLSGVKGIKYWFEFDENNLPCNVMEKVTEINEDYVLMNLAENIMYFTVLDQLDNERSGFYTIELNNNKPEFTLNSMDGTELSTGTNNHKITKNNSIRVYTDNPNIDKIVYGVNSSLPDNTAAVNVSETDDQGKTYYSLVNIAEEEIYYVWAIDKYGNISEKAQSFIYTTNGPKLSKVKKMDNQGDFQDVKMIEGQDRYWINQTEVKIEYLDDNLNIQKVVYVVTEPDGSLKEKKEKTKNVDGEFVLDNLENGKTYTVWAVNDLGLKSEKTLIAIDTDQPEFKIDLSSGEELESHNDVYWVKNGISDVWINGFSGEISSVTYFKNDDENNIMKLECSEGKYKLEISEEAEKYTVLVSDYAGNESCFVLRRDDKVNFDNEIMIVRGDGREAVWNEDLKSYYTDTREINIIINSTESESGIKKIEYNGQELVNGETQSVLGTYMLIMEQDTYTLDIEDYAGNKINIRLVYNDELVNIIPEGNDLYNIEDNKYYLKEDVDIIIKGPVDIRKIKFQIKGIGEEFPLSSEIKADEKHKLSEIVGKLECNEYIFKWTDRSGNKGEVIIVYDNSKPDFVLTNTAKDKYVNGNTKENIKITGITNNLSGISEIYYYIESETGEKTPVNKINISPDKKGDYIIPIVKLANPGQSAFKLSEGENTLFFTLKSKAGVASIEHPVKVKYDSRPPKFSLLYDHSDQFVNEKKKTAVISARLEEEELSGIHTVKYEILNQNNTPVNTADSNDFQLDNDKYVLKVKDLINNNDLPDGTYRIKAVMRDNAGNESREYVTVRIDNTAPTFNVKNSEGTKWINKEKKGTVSLTDISKEISGIKKVTYSINNGNEVTWEAKNGKYVLSFKELIEEKKALEGINTILVTMTDGADNPTKELMTFSIDTVNPEFSLENTANRKKIKHIKKGTTDVINISYLTNNTSEIDTIYYQIGKGENKEWPNNGNSYSKSLKLDKIIDNLKQGENQVYVIVKDQAGNQSVKESVSVFVDKNKPEFAISNSAGNKYVTSTTTAKLTLNYEGTDIPSGIKSITYEIKPMEKSKEVKKKGKWKPEDGTYTPLQMQDLIEDLPDDNYIIQVTVTNNTDISNTHDVVLNVDKSAPDFQIVNSAKTEYKRTDTNATISLINFQNILSGIKSVSYKIENTGDSNRKTIKNNTDKEEWTDWIPNEQGKYIFGIGNTNIVSKLCDGENKVIVCIVDNAGNTSIKEELIFIDNTAPDFSLNYQYDDVFISKKEQAEISVTGLTDETSGIYTCQYKIGNEQYKDFPVFSMKVNDLIKENGFGQGKNSFVVKVTDNAHNYKEKRISVNIDTENPFIIDYFFAESDKVEKEGYCYYFKEAAELSVTAGDSINLQTIVLIKDGHQPEIKSVSGEKNTVKFMIPAGYKGELSVYATDHVDNKSEIQRIGDTIIETEEMHNSYADIAFSKPETSLRDGTGNELYREESIPVSVKVFDSFSGIKQIDWSVSSEDAEALFNKSGSVKVDSDGNISEYTVQTDVIKKEKNIITEISIEIPVVDNSNDINVTVKLTDNAGHITERQTLLSNDTTSPTVTVSYDNNIPDAENGQIFNRERTAFVSVTERNFNPDNAVISITNTDGVIPEISGWTLTQGTGNLDDSVYTATITYSADGDYEFQMTLQDMAGNEAEIDFGNSMSPQNFTIDRTRPVITVSYDNNNGSSNYYKDSRIATITVNEHNFSESRLNLTVLKNGVNEPPQTGNWNHSGDTHSVTVAFSDEAEYSLTAFYTDMAGNTVESQITDTFFVDKSEPQMMISGIENQKAYRSEQIGFEISGTDTYFDSLTVSLTRIDSFGNRTSIDLEKMAIDNGEKYIVENLTQDGIYQLSYTAADKSERNVGETLVFSVNRNGSSYMFPEQVMKLNKSYVKSIDSDIVIKEVNVNELLMESVVLTLTRGSSSIELKEDVDFTLSKNTGSEQWCEYIYTINKSCFTEDGVYSVSISSKDRSGNISVSDLEIKAAELTFAVDRTIPICNVMNLKSNTTYAVDSKRVEFTVSDNIMLSKVSVLLNGTELLSLTEDTLRQIADSGENISFDISNSDSAQNIVIQYVDKAGNEGITEIKDFYVTTNLWIRYTTNTPLVISTLIGVATVLGLAAFILIYRKKIK